MTTFIAGLNYFVLVFTLGFLLGTIRTLSLLVLPGVSETTAVLIELPIILTGSWGVCSFVIKNAALPPIASARITMGAVAFIMLIGAEILLALYGFDRTLWEQFEIIKSPPGLIGLSGQVAFALFPLMQMLANRRY